MMEPERAFRITFTVWNTNCFKPFGITITISQDHQLTVNNILYKCNNVKPKAKDFFILFNWPFSQTHSAPFSQWILKVFSIFPPLAFSLHLMELHEWVMMFPHFAKNRRINHPPSCKSSQWDRDDEYIRYSRYFQRKQYLKDNLPHLSACEWFCLGGHSVHSMHSLTVIQMAHIGKIGLKWQTSSKAKCHKPSLFFTSLAIFTSLTIFA